MDGIQEGGVHTQKVSVTIGAIALLMMGAFMCCVLISDDSEAVTVNVEAETDFCGVNTSLSSSDATVVKYTLTADTTYYYKAVLLDSSETSSGKVSPDTGSVSSTSTQVKVTAPVTSGDYMFNVKFFSDSEMTVQVEEKNVPLKVVDPIVLKFTLKNGGSASVDVTVYFKVNGEKMDDSEQTVTVSAGGTQDVTYNYIVRDVADTTYSLESDQKIINESITGLGEEKRFYAHDNDYSVIMWLVIGVLVVLAVIMFIVYRKPVVNKGKPKGRR